MYKNLMEYGRSLLSQCALDATGFLSDVYKRSTRAKKFLADDVQCGKSMIEMLGVLAIIGVLSVGGIAGYSKAMEKFKVNKLVAEYGEVLRGLIEYREHFLRVNPDKQTGLAEALQAADVVPNNWLRKDAIWFTDSQDNSVAFYSSKNDIAKGVSMDIYLGGMTKVEGKNISENFSEKLCVEILSNLALPLSMDITAVSVASYVKNWKSKVRYGAKYCSVENGNCLAQSSLADFQNMCKFCEGQEGECNIGIRF